MSLAKSGKRREPSSGIPFLSYRSRNLAFRFIALSGISSPSPFAAPVSMMETTGAVDVFTLAVSTHTFVAEPVGGGTHTGSTRLSAAQSATAVHAVVVTLAPIGPLGDAHTEITYANCPLRVMACN